MRPKLKVLRWYKEIKENKRSFSDMIINKTEHLIGKMTKTIQWATKSYDVWVLLQNILFLVRPKKILEFGAGRSTNYLSEYAFKNNAEYISIEHTLYYYFKIKEGLKLSFTNTEYLKYVPLDVDWYNIKILDKFLKNYDDIDFFYLDGPTNCLNKRRDPQLFYDYILPKLKNIKVILIDDTQWSHGIQTADKLVKHYGLIRFDVGYMAGSSSNKLTLLFDKKIIKIIGKLPEYLKVLMKKYDY